MLIVEDSPTQAARLKYVLSEAGHSVSVADRASKALELARREKPDLLVSDVNMPEMDGFGLCRAVRGDAALCDLSILLLTGMSDPEDIIRGLDAGADSYLTKPYAESELAERIGFVLTNKVSTRVAEEPIEVSFLGKKHIISASREQMLGLLLSTYESAAQQNRRLNREQLNLKMVQREQERNLRKLEKHQEIYSQTLEVLLSAAGYPVLVVDTQGVLLKANEEAEEAFGLACQDFFSNRAGQTPNIWDGQMVRWMGSRGEKVSGKVRVTATVWSEAEACLLQVSTKKDEI